MCLQHNTEVIEKMLSELYFMMITYYTELLSYSTRNMNEIRKNADIFDKIIMADDNI